MSYSSLSTFSLAISSLGLLGCCPMLSSAARGAALVAAARRQQRRRCLGGRRHAAHRCRLLCALPVCPVVRVAGCARERGGGAALGPG